MEQRGCGGDCQRGLLFSGRLNEPVFEQKREKLADRQADNVAVGSGNRADVKGSLALDAIGSRLVHGITGIDIGLEDLSVEAAEGDRSGFAGQFFNRSRYKKNGDTGDDSMGNALELVEDGKCLSGIGGFAEDCLTQGNHGIRGNNAAFRVLVGKNPGFGERHAAGKDFRGFIGQWRFVDMRRLNGKLQTELFEELPASGGVRGEDQGDSGGKHEVDKGLEKTENG